MTPTLTARTTDQVNARCRLCIHILYSTFLYKQTQQKKKKKGKKKAIPKKTRGICLCARDRRTAKERDIDTERQKGGKKVGWCKSAI